MADRTPGDAVQVSSTTQGLLLVSGLVFAGLAIIVVAKLVNFISRITHTSAGRKSDHQQRPTLAEPDRPTTEKRARGPDLKTLIKQSKAAEKAKKSSSKEDAAAHHHLFLTTLKGHQDVVNGLGWNADGTAIATACSDLQVRVYDLSKPTKTPLFKFFRTRRIPLDVGLGDTPSDAIVLLQDIPNEATVEMWRYTAAAKDNAAGWQQVWQVRQVHGKEAPMCMDVRQSSAGVAGMVGARVGIAVCLSQKKDVKILNFQGKEVGHAEPNSLNNHQLAVSYDSRFLAVSSFTSDVKIWELKHTGGFAGAAKVMDLKGHSSQVMAVALSPDGRRAATASKDGTLRIWNIDVRYTVNEDPKNIIKVPLPLPKGKCYEKLAWGPDGTLAACLGGRVHFISTASGQLLEELEAHEGEITGMHWAPMPLSTLTSDGGQPCAVLATCSVDRRVRLWRSPAASTSS